MTDHHYETALSWNGSTGAGYRHYDRTHSMSFGSRSWELSADPAFRGDPDVPNPEQLLLAAAGSCQLLSFLGAAALAHVDVISYSDTAHAVMPGDASPMRITEITLDITVVVRGADEQTVRALLEKAHEQCYVANSLAVPVNVRSTVEVRA